MPSVRDIILLIT